MLQELETMDEEEQEVSHEHASGSARECECVPCGVIVLLQVSVHDAPRQEYLRALPAQDRMDIENAIRTIAMADYDTQGPGLASDPNLAFSEYLTCCGLLVSSVLRCLCRGVQNCLSQHSDIKMARNVCSGCCSGRR